MTNLGILKGFSRPVERKLVCRFCTLLNICALLVVDRVIESSIFWKLCFILYNLSQSSMYMQKIGLVRNY